MCPTLKRIAIVPTDSKVLSIAINTTENRLLTVSNEGATLWRLGLDGPSSLGNFLLFPDGGYIFYTPDGYYLNSGSSRALAFAVGDRMVPFDEFDLRFNRPDLVLMRIGLGSPELIQGYAAAYRNRVERSGAAEEVVTGKIPRPLVTIRTARRLDDTAILQIVATSATAKLSRTYVWVNGVPCFGRSGIASSESEQSITVRLSAGANHIEVSVADERGAESIRDATDMTLDPPAVGPQLYVLAVGVSQYQNSDFNLKYADHDATAVGSFFEGQRYKFNRVSVDLKTNNSASHDAILRALDAMRSVPLDDYVIISFAGHGLLDDKLNFYFAPYDMDFADPSAKGISYKDLEDALYAIPSRHKVLLLDSCHSGEVRSEVIGTSFSAQRDRQTREDMRIVARPSVQPGTRDVSFNQVAFNDADSATYIEQLFADLRRGPGASILASSAARQYSYESGKYNGGVFTYELLRCMRSGEADLIRDGEFHVSELRKCVANHVLEDTGGKQRPTARGRDPFDQSIAREDYLVRSYSTSTPRAGIVALASQADGSAIAWGNTEEIAIFDAVSGNLRRTFKSPCGPRLFLGISSDEQNLVAGCQPHFNDPQLAFWLLNNGSSASNVLSYGPHAHCQPTKENDGNGQASTSGATLCLLDIGNWQAIGGDGAPDGTLILAVHMVSKQDNKWTSALELWDAASGKLLRTIPVADLSFSPIIGISPNHTLVTINDALGGSGWRLTMLDLVTGSVLWQKESPHLIQTAFSWDSQQLAMTSVVESEPLHEKVQLLDARTGLEAAAVELPPDDQATTAIAFTPDDSFLAVGLSRSGAREQTEDTVSFMSVPELKSLNRRLPQPCPVRAIRFAAAGTRVITGCSTMPSNPSDPAAAEFRIWDWGQLIQDLRIQRTEHSELTLP